MRAWLRRQLEGRAWLAVPLLVAAVVLVAAAAFALWPRDGSAARVQPRAQLADYTWGELAAIGRELSACGDEWEATRKAATYGLCGADGTFSLEHTKDLVLTDGSVVRVVLADVWHDVRSDGGRAGLTFVLADAADTHAMNHAHEDAEGVDADSTGGWAASDMRVWLADTFVWRLPPELRDNLVSVQKRTANAVDLIDELADPGKLAGTGDDWASETTDRLWLLSAAEVCGSVAAREDMGVDETMGAVYAAEGSAYRLFAATGLAAFEPHAELVRSLVGESEPCTWWLRTKTLEFGDGFWLVGTDGTPLNGLGEDVRVVDDPQYAPEELWGPDHARGVVVGFCL